MVSFYVLELKIVFVRFCYESGFTRDLKDDRRKVVVKVWQKAMRHSGHRPWRTGAVD